MQLEAQKNSRMPIPWSTKKQPWKFRLLRSSCFGDQWQHKLKAMVLGYVGGSVSGLDRIPGVILVSTGWSHCLGNCPSVGWYKIQDNSAVVKRLPCGCSVKMRWVIQGRVARRMMSHKPSSIAECCAWNLAVTVILWAEVHCLHGGLIAKSRLRLKVRCANKVNKGTNGQFVPSLPSTGWYVRVPGVFSPAPLPYLFEFNLVQMEHISGNSVQGLDIDGRQGFSFGTDSDWNALQVGGSGFLLHGWLLERGKDRKNTA